VKLEQRKNNRIILSIPLRYKVFHMDNLEKEVREQTLNLKAEIQDLSFGGIQVVSNNPFQPGIILELELEIPGHRLVRTVAKVVWCKPASSSNGAEFNSGIQFIPVYEDDLMMLNEYLKVGG
jgi:hypothetical protein